MKRAHNTRTLEYRKMANYRKFFTTIITAYILTVLIIIPVTKAFGNLYVSYDKSLHINKTIATFNYDENL